MPCFGTWTSINPQHSHFFFRRRHSLHLRPRGNVPLETPPGKRPNDWPCPGPQCREARLSAAWVVVLLVTRDWGPSYKHLRIVEHATDMIHPNDVLPNFSSRIKRSDLVTIFKLMEFSFNHQPGKLFSNELVWRGLKLQAKVANHNQDWYRLVHIPKHTLNSKSIKSGFHSRSSVLCLFNRNGW